VAYDLALPEIFVIEFDAELCGGFFELMWSSSSFMIRIFLVWHFTVKTKERFRRSAPRASSAPSNALSADNKEVDRGNALVYIS
jgi:hypothetical protein